MSLRLGGLFEKEGLIGFSVKSKGHQRSLGSMNMNPIVVLSLTESQQ